MTSILSYTINKRFPRLNNISYLSLIPSIVLFLFAGGIENGVGTGWTLNMEYFFLFCKLEGYKLFSMREYLQNNEIGYLRLPNKSYVRMLMTRGQYAWVAKKNFVTHQRLNKEYLVKNEKEWFEQWLVGITDGEGTFGFYIQNNKWTLGFKIALSLYNLRALYYIKTNLGIGNITKDGTKAQIAIRDRKFLENVIFPIFDKYFILTSKYFNYMKLKKTFSVVNNSNLDKSQKDELLFGLKLKTIPENYKSPAWKDIRHPLNYDYILNVISKPWLSGFVEGEGSFYLISKYTNRIVHGFGISQKLDKIILESIAKLLHIKTLIRYKEKHNYILDTTNSRAVKNIIKYFKDNLIGMKSVEYKIWARSYVKNKWNLDKLNSIREIMRKTNKKLVSDNGMEQTNNFELLDCKGVGNAKPRNGLASNNPLINNSAFNKLEWSDCSVKKNCYHTNINIFNKKLNNYLFNYFLFYYFNYLLNKLKKYKVIYYIVVLVYSIYRNIDKMLLTRQGLFLLLVFGLLTEDILGYYQYFFSLYIITLIKNYLKSNEEILYNYPNIRIFLIALLDFVQGLLLIMILNIISSTLVSYLNRVFGYILKMFGQGNNNTKSQGGNNHNNPNGNNPNKHKIFVKDDGDSSEEDLENGYRETSKRISGWTPVNYQVEANSEVETIYDSKGRISAKVYYRYENVNGQLGKRIYKSDNYKKGRYLSTLYTEE